jgi:PAS domain S-box-containing protein
MENSIAQTKDWLVLTSFLNASNTSLIITDAKADDQPIIFANPAFEKMTGYSLADVLGKNCRFLQNDDRSQQERASISSSIRREEACEHLLRNYRKNGQMFWNKLYIFPFKKNGEVTHFVGIQHDVTAEISLLSALRNTAAERAQLIEMLHSERDQLTRLSHDLINAQEAERKALARELHDEFGQRLCAIKMLLDRSKPFVTGPQIGDLWSQAGQELADLIAMARNISAMLRPPSLELFGLEATLHDLLSRQLTRGPTWNFEYTHVPQHLPPAAEISIFRIVQESITNIVRHANATHVVVKVIYDAEKKEITLTISDNGSGFESSKLDSLRKYATHMGLTGMSERVKLLGGEFHVDSDPGSGTRVIVTLPQKLNNV